MIGAFWASRACAFRRSALCSRPQIHGGTTVPKTTSVHLRKIKRPLRNGKTRYEWHLRWHGSDGRHYCKKLANCNQMPKREAEAKRRAFQVEMDRCEIPRNKPKAMTLEEFAEYHGAMVKSDRKPSTLYEYRLSARLAAQALGKTTRIQDITAADVGRIKNQLKGSAATRAKHISRLRAMFNHAKRWGLIHGDNPFANQPMPRFTARKMRIFSPEEIKAMLAAAKTTWWKAFILVGVTAGPRKEEILNLMWRDVDFKGRTIIIAAKKAEEFTSSDTSKYETLEWSPKTYAVRTLPTPDQTIEVLRRLKDESDGSPYVFVSLRRLTLISAKIRAGARRDRAETCNNMLRDFKVIQRRAAKAIGSKEWIIGTVHDLRRTYGTRIADVVPMHVLQKWMGHSDIGVTAKYYLDVSNEHAQVARATLAAS